MMGRTMKEFRRYLSLLALVPLVAACGDSTGPAGLKPADVAGLYRICAIEFVPENPTQPRLDVLTTVFETTNVEVQKPRIALDANGRSTLMFTKKGEFGPRLIEGAFDLNGDRVTVRIPATASPSTYLLPEILQLTYQEEIPELSAEAGVYSVKRDDYARLAGIPAAGLAEQIPGRLSVRAQSLPCE